MRCLHAIKYWWCPGCEASLGPSNDDYPQHAADMAMARVIASQERVIKTRERSR